MKKKGIFRGSYRRIVSVIYVSQLLQQNAKLLLQSGLKYILSISLHTETSPTLLHQKEKRYGSTVTKRSKINVIDIITIYVIIIIIKKMYSKL